MISDNDGAAGADDMELLRSYVESGHSQAIGMLIHRHREMVMATSRRQLGCAADAEDAAQQVFLALIENAGKIRSNVGAWLYRCTVNTATSIARNRRNQTRHEIEKIRLTQGRRQDDDVVLKERLAILADCLGRLDTTDHWLILRNCVAGDTQSNIASSLGVSQQAVAKRIGKALGRLRIALMSRGVIPSILAAVVLLARRAASAAIPQFLKAVLPSASSATLASGGAAGAGSVGVVQAGAAAILVLAAAVATYEGVSPGRSSSPPAEVVSTLAAGSVVTQADTHPPVGVAPVDVVSDRAGNRTQITDLPAFSDSSSPESSVPGRRLGLASGMRGKWQNPLVIRDAFNWQMNLGTPQDDAPNCLYQRNDLLWGRPKDKASKTITPSGDQREAIAQYSPAPEYSQAVGLLPGRPGQVALGDTTIYRLAGPSNPMLAPAYQVADQIDNPLLMMAMALGATAPLGWQAGGGEFIEESVVFADKLSFGKSQASGNQFNNPLLAGKADNQTLSGPADAEIFRSSTPQSYYSLGLSDDGYDWQIADTAPPKPDWALEWDAGEIYTDTNSSAVPEPATMLLLMTGSLACLLRRNKP
jgi:RNA polymerase sigma factor (sigma-70 family)